MARYRNFDRDWQLTRFLSGAKLQQPTLFIGGVFDVAVSMNQDLINQLQTTMPNLKKQVAAQHWTLDSAGTPHRSQSIVD